ncbi:hypothetical protein DH86_00003451 [Scytalidium sp. 3C]|nr:hypothetical protein DH86_00003451 [Scytalidium sp. 3C]
MNRSTCTFQLSASGGQSGTVGQLGDGQNRIGGGLPQATYTINNGAITDSAGRGCILTSPTTQWQCDTGASPTSGFDIGANGQVTYSGSSTFYACPASDSEWNIYTQPAPNQQKCVQQQCSCASETQGSTPVVPASGATTPAVTGPTTPSSAPGAPAPGVSSPAVGTTPAPAPAPESSAPSPAPAPAPESSAPAPAPAPAPESSAPESSAPSPAPAPAPSSEASSPAPSPAPSSQAPSPPAPAPAPSSEASSPAPSAAPSSQAPTPATSGAPSASSSGASCTPTVLTGSSTSGNYQYPHLIVPVSSSTPNTPAGTSYNGIISSNTSTIFNFDIPQTYSGKTCSLIFLLPQKSQLETSSYTYSGSGSIDFAQLSGPATQSTTWNNAPKVSNDFGTFTITQGSSTLVKSFQCPAGQTVTYELSAKGDTDLNYFQDWNPSPIGLYVTPC